MIESKPLRVGLFGISGVGKSYLGRRIIAARPDILYFAASALLKETHQATGEALRTASADAIDRNQNVLADMVNRAAACRPNAPILLDAHSVIDNDTGLVPVPYRAIAPIGLSVFLFLRDDPVSIIKRRRDPSRTRPHRSVTELIAQQNFAQGLCADYAISSGSQFVLLDASEGDATLTSALQVFV